MFARPIKCKYIAVLMLVLLATLIAVGINLRFMPLIQIIEEYQIYTRHVDISDIVTKAVLAEDDYQPFSTFMPIEIFNKLNLKHQYKTGVGFSCDFVELYQRKDPDDNRLVYIDVRCSYTVEDRSKQKIISIRKGLQQYTVFIDQNKWHILNFSDPISNEWYYK